jgi:hypothetical protein
MPKGISTTGLLHFVFGALGFLCLGVSCFFTARALSRRGNSSLGAASLVAGLAVIVGFFGGVMLPIGVAGIWFAVVAGWMWLSVVSLQLGHPPGA